MSRREARNMIAAGLALRGLPRIDEALARGELSWSKVRAIAGVAIARHEARWLEFARTRSIQEVLLGVRSVRAGEAPRDASDRSGPPPTR